LLGLRNNSANSFNNCIDILDRVCDEFKALVLSAITVSMRQLEYGPSAPYREPYSSLLSSGFDKMKYDKRHSLDKV
jgi:hypothetical protein